LVAERDFGEVESGDNPAPTNRIAAVGNWIAALIIISQTLKSVRVREYKNVR
jgi:hypothetical protein